MAAVDYFLKIEGIDGESTDRAHKDSIDVESFSWGVNQTGSPTGEGGGAGKAQFQDFHFTSKTSKASPKLFLKCASGEHIVKAELFCRKAGGEQTDFMHIKMTDVLVSSYQNGGSGGDFPMDQISLNFAKIEFTFVPQNTHGSVGTAVSASWDVRQNRSE